MAETSAGRVWEVKGSQGFDEKIRINLEIPAWQKMSEGEVHNGHRNQTQTSWELFKGMDTYFLCSVCPPEFLWLILLAILLLCCGSCNIQAFTGTTKK